MDGVYYARAVGLTGSLFDMSSVDVLKGPQGTLVGRNTTGGALLLETNATDRRFRRLYEGAGRRLRPIHACRAPSIFRCPTICSSAPRSPPPGNKGYITQRFHRSGDRLFQQPAGDGTEKLAGRFSLKWVPDDSFSLLLRADLSAEHDTGSTYHDLGYFVGTALANGNKPSICNIPGTCVAFTDLLGHQVAPYFTTVTATSASGVNTVARRL